MPISLQVSRSLSCSGELRHGITALPSGPGAGRKRLRAPTRLLTGPSSPPMTTSGRPLSRQKTACWEKELCLRKARAPAAAFLLLLPLPLLSESNQLGWSGEGGSEEAVRLVRSESRLSCLRGVQRSASARVAQESGADGPPAR